MKYNLLILLTAILAFSCRGTKHDKTTVEAAMQHYNKLLQKMDADSIALLYTPDGDLGTTAHGRDSIRSFLASFKNVRVLYISSVTDSISINADTALQDGSYHQVALLNEKDTANLTGKFHARWIWTQTGGWLIRKMETTPDK